MKARARAEVNAVLGGRSPTAQDLPRLRYPFGAGQRLCIGNNFALMEATLVTADVLQHFRLRSVPGHLVEPEPLASLRPKGGMPMLVEPLHASA
ncbi:hypothetical protein CYFUS_001737 [Cystobacter fuscus]|uniref:Cytochrome P450 n=1 Tax=Cystobacter fuscus TaxID=43 RepID=A0A250IYE8_9BACT|nr:cytochrome P450 [Cystobacter fuscus]ATB36323.1 hypothetical protein CYFUS_001737 [Cystobacter fuscus]